jgi:hypothetical protein
MPKSKAPPAPPAKSGGKSLPPWMKPAPGKGNAPPPMPMKKAGKKK